MTPGGERARPGVHAALSRQFPDEMSRDEVAKLRQNAELPSGWSCSSNGSFFHAGRYRGRRTWATPTAFPSTLWDGTGAITMNKKQKEIAEWRNYLIRLKAPPALLKQFDEITKFAIVTKSTLNIKCHVIEACVSHHFTAPFEQDGNVRVLRYQGDDCSVFSRGNPAEENSYRRGYDQGFSAALKMIKDRKSVKDMEEFGKSILAWRRRPFQIIGSLPGSEEGEKTWLKK